MLIKHVYSLFISCSRGCYFKDERKLTMYRYYTRRNCMMECVSIIQSDTCNCTQVAIPRFNRTKICQISKMKCYRYANSIVEKNIFGQTKNVKHYPECHCLPLCNQYEYDFDIVSIDEMRIPPTNSV